MSIRSLWGATVAAMIVMVGMLLALSIVGTASALAADAAVAAEPLAFADALAALVSLWPELSLTGQIGLALLAVFLGLPQALNILRGLFPDWFARRTWDEWIIDNWPTLGRVIMFAWQLFAGSLGRRRA